MVGSSRFSGPAYVMAARMTDASDDKRHFLVSYNKAWSGSYAVMVGEGPQEHAASTVGRLGGWSDAVHCSLQETQRLG